MSFKIRFPDPPAYDCYTTCERNAQLQFVEAGRLHEVESEFVDINCTTEKSKFIRSRELISNAVFLEKIESLKSRLVKSMFRHGLTGFLVELSSLEQKRSTQIFKVISKWASVSLSFYKWLKSPHLAMPTDILINEFSSMTQWKDNYIRCFAWHPHCNTIAIALKDDEILIKNFECSKDLQPLKHASQKGIAGLAWRPFSATILAVACHSCLLIWHLSPSGTSMKSALSQNVQVLVKPGHCPLSSVAWNPHGNLLVSCSPVDNAIVIWNTDIEEYQGILKVGCGGFISAQFAPDNLKLMAACSSPSFRLFQCVSWNCETWGNLLGRCQSYCWSPDGKTLLFATSEDPTIYSLAFLPSDLENTLKAVKSPVPVIALNCVEGVSEPRHVGNVQSLAWDPNGERLAVMFKGPSANLIALFQTKFSPTFEAIPRGFVKGRTDEVPVCMSFKPSYKHGSVLTIAWSSGRVSNVCLYYTARKLLSGHAGPIITTPGRTSNTF